MSILEKKEKNEYKPGLKRDTDKELVNSLDDTGKINLTIEGYDKTADEWDKTRQNFWPELIDGLRKYIKPNTKILDIGCGNGRLVKELEILNIDYLGVDPSLELVKLAKIKNPNKLFQKINGLELSNKKDPENINLEDKSFDQVISIAVLHHIPPNKVIAWLSEAHRVLKDDSTSIFTTWNLGESRYDLNENKDAVIGFIHHKNTRYVHYYDYMEIENIFKISNFKVLEIKEIKRESGMSNTVIIVQK